MLDVIYILFHNMYYCDTYLYILNFVNACSVVFKYCLNDNMLFKQILNYNIAYYI